jgi:hypothetical protein
MLDPAAKPHCVFRYSANRRFSLAFAAESGAVFAASIDELKCSRIDHPAECTEPHLDRGAGGWVVVE